MESLVDRLRRKLDEAFAEPWMPGRRLEAALAPDGGVDPATGALRGEVEFRMVEADGRARILHRARLDGVGTPAALDDWLAEALSTLLMNHPVWSN
ncbi:MAG TPA: hypothetical protein VLV50_14720 [Stellaceae bacterium]|nr:hypothetical protein [Stellaceae bacterium]